MAYDQVDSVTVQTLDGQESIAWGTRVSVDRKGGLHVYGEHHQHRVFKRGQWKGYMAKAQPSYGSSAYYEGNPSA